MIAVLQRAASASVRVDDKTVGEIGKGLLILLGVATTDSEKDAEALVRKIVRCRIFEDEAAEVAEVTEVAAEATEAAEEVAEATETV